MNLIRYSLNSYLQFLRLRGQSRIRSQLGYYKFLSMNSLMHCKESNKIQTSNSFYDISETENNIWKESLNLSADNHIFDFSVDNEICEMVIDDEETPERNHEGLQGKEQNTYHFNRNLLFHDIVTIAGNEVLMERIKQQSCFHLFKLMYSKNPINDNIIHVLNMKNILNLINKGLKPECIFIKDSNIIDEFFYEQTDISFYDAGFFLEKSVDVSEIAFFKYSDLKELARKVKPKLPLTVICDCIDNINIVNQLLNMAASLGCENFITTNDCKGVYFFSEFSGIECSYIKTHFESSWERVMELINSRSTVFIVSNFDSEAEPFPEKNEISNKKYSKSDSDRYHVLGIDDAWETGEIVLYVTYAAKPSRLKCLSMTKNLKFIQIPYVEENNLKVKSDLVLFELLREYKLRKSLKKTKNKANKRKSLETEKI